jgi:hypothetical protein
MREYLARMAGTARRHYPIAKAAPTQFGVSGVRVAAEEVSIRRCASYSTTYSDVWSWVLILGEGDLDPPE